MHLKPLLRLQLRREFCVSQMDHAGLEALAYRGQRGRGNIDSFVGRPGALAQGYPRIVGARQSGRRFGLDHTMDRRHVLFGSERLGIHLGHKEASYTSAISVCHQIQR